MTGSASLLSALGQLQDKPTEKEQLGSAIQKFAGGIQPNSAFGAIAKGLTEGFATSKSLEGKKERSDRSKELEGLIQHELKTAQSLEQVNLKSKQQDLVKSIVESDGGELNEIVGRIKSSPRDIQAKLLENATKNNATVQNLMKASGIEDPTNLSVSLEEGTNNFIFKDATTGEPIGTSTIEQFMTNEGRAKLAKEAREQGTFERDDPQQKINTFNEMVANGTDPKVAAAAVEFGKIESTGAGTFDTKNLEGKSKGAGIIQAKSTLGTLKSLVFNEDGSLNKANLLAAEAKGIPFVDSVFDTQGRSIGALGLNAVNSIFRTESGAAVPEPEVQRYLSMFMPSIGDDVSTAELKLTLLDQRFDAIIDTISGIDPRLSDEQRQAQLNSIFANETAAAEVAVRRELKNAKAVGSATKISSQADFNKLKKGDAYINPSDGNTYIKK